MQRHGKYLTAGIADTGDTSGEIDVKDMAGALFYVPAGWTGGASVTLEFKADAGGSFWASIDSVGAITVTAGEGFEVPEAYMKAGAIRFVSEDSVTRDETIYIVASS